jgi:hypothetical protein
MNIGTEEKLFTAKTPTPFFVRFMNSFVPAFLRMPTGAIDRPASLLRAARQLSQVVDQGFFHTEGNPRLYAKNRFSSPIPLEAATVAARVPSPWSHYVRLLIR